MRVHGPVPLRGSGNQQVEQAVLEEQVSGMVQGIVGNALPTGSTSVYSHCSEASRSTASVA
jgi:hypothetical protein